MTRLLLAAVLLPSLAVAEQIELHRTAEVGTPLVRLGQVARVENAGLADLTLGPRSTLRIVTADHVRSRLQSLGHYSDSVTLIGASRCELTTPVAEPAAIVQPVSVRQRDRARSRLAAEVAHRIETAFPDAGRVSVEIAISDDAADAVAQQATLRLRGGHANWRLPQPMEVLTDDGRSVRFLATITTRPLVAVAARPLARGEVVQASHLKWEPADPKSPAGVSEPGLLVGREVKRSIAAGRPIRKSDVAPVLLVRSGDIVSVHAGGEGFRVTRTMRSRSAGGAGDIVTLVSLDNRQTLTATVTAYHECEIAPAAATAAAGPAVTFEGARP